MGEYVEEFKGTAFGETTLQQARPCAHLLSSDCAWTQRTLEVRVCHVSGVWVHIMSCLTTLQQAHLSVF